MQNINSIGRMPRAVTEHFGFSRYEWRTLLEKINNLEVADFVLSYWRFIRSGHLKTAYCREWPDAEIEHSQTRDYGKFFATADGEQRSLSDWLSVDSATSWKVFELTTAPR